MKEIKLKRQPKWVARAMFGIGAVVGLAVALHTHPIEGTNAQSAGTTSDFMHYETVDGIGTITICDLYDGSKCITMMDRNLGASKSGTTCSSADNGACGYHYQWGNNHGFEIGCWTDGCSDSVTNGAIDDEISTEGYGPGNYFNGNVFRKITNTRYDWSSPSNDNLRGGSGDNQANNRGYDEDNNVAINVEDRRGPCPEGYHVPSQGEWGTLLKYWEENYIRLTSNIITLNSYDATVAGLFKEDFMIPFAGYRGYTSAKIFSVGYYADFWSSSPDDSYSNRARHFYLNPDSASVNYSNYRASALSVRCFKNSYLSFPSVAVRMFDGQNILYRGKLVPGSKMSDNEELMAIINQDMTKTGYAFLGWYKRGEESSFNFDTVLTEYLDLYAKWTCAEGYKQNNIGKCIDEGAGVFYDEEKGLVKITDGEKTYYIKDKNQGATVLGGVPERVMNQYLLDNKWNSLQNEYDENCNNWGCNRNEIESELLQYANTLMGNKFSDVNDVYNYINTSNLLRWEYDYWYSNTCYEEIGRGGLSKGGSSRGNTDGNLKECTDEDKLNAMNEITNKNFTNYNEAENYVNNYDPFNPEYGEVDVNSYGTYYYRGNNNGAAYDELGIDYSSNRANVSQSAINRGFNGGVLGESDGWKEGAENPCNPDEGEYLPTVDDWKDAMGIWSDINGGELYYEDYGENGYFYPDSSYYGQRMEEFLDDILVPNAGNIKYGAAPIKSRSLSYNTQEESKKNKLNFLALLFASPVMAEYQGYWEYISFDNYPYLWTALDSENKMGYFNEWNRYYYENINPNEYNDNYNAVAAPVRCFLDPEYIEELKANTTFIIPTDDDFEISVGEEVYTEIPDTMTVTTGNISEINDEPVYGEVTVDFGLDESAKFSKLVQVKIPVEGANRVVVKVKHEGSDEYNFDGLTKNSNASCDANGRPTSSQYNGETITVVNGFATIYTCEASSFIAVGEGPLLAQIILSVDKGELTIGTETGTLDLGQVSVSNNAQEIIGEFGADSFWVEDMKGVESGYYTTISVTDLTGNVASHVISANNISLKTENGIPSLISGADVSEALVVFGDDIKSRHNTWSAPVTYFNREDTPSNLAGRVGKWGDNLQVKVNIPAHTPSDIYRGTITYTLYDLDSQN